MQRASAKAHPVTRLSRVGLAGPVNSILPPPLQPKQARTLDVEEGTHGLSSLRRSASLAALKLPRRNPTKSSFPARFHPSSV